MKAFWLLICFGFELTLVSTFCPDKCLCLWHSDQSLAINCSGSEQKEVPYGIDPKVKVLDLSHNALQTFYHAKQLKVVEEIDLSNNKITEAYFGTSYKYLKLIDLSYNSITDLTKVDVRGVENLKKLYMSRNFKLHQVTGLKSESLEMLDLSHCFISFLNETFLSDLPNIRIIDLSFNPLNSITNIESESLRNLDVSHGKIKALTRSNIYSLLNLNRLNMSFNPDLKIDFSYENSCWNITDLDLSNSGISELGDLFPFCSLQTLNASFNKIQFIEVKTFFNNCELISLNLSNNLISNIHESAFFTTDKLKILDLSYNKIQNVNFTRNLKETVDLNLSKNQISNFLEIILKKVINLNLSHNKINELRINLNENAPFIEYLNLSYNNILHLNRLDSKSIKNIDLSYCHIAYIDLNTFEGADNLIEINLVGNDLTHINSAVVQNLSNLKSLLLFGNPWLCNCHSVEFKKLFFFLMVERPLINLHECRCNRTGEVWAKACLEEWRKEKEWKKTIYSVTVSIAIALIVVAVIFFCRYFNDKKRAAIAAARESIDRSDTLGRRLENYQESVRSLQVEEEEEFPNRSSTPPPNYEAALLLPKLTEEQRQLAISTLSIAFPKENTEAQENQSESSTEENK